MRFYERQHRLYCGIDLHARSMYVCLVDQAGTRLVHQDIAAKPEAFLEIIAPYRDEVVVGVECMFTWYWLADLREQEKIAFVLGHAPGAMPTHGVGMLAQGHYGGLQTLLIDAVVRMPTPCVGMAPGDLVFAAAPS